MLGTIAEGARRYDRWLDGPASLLAELFRAGRRANLAATVSPDGAILSLPAGRGRKSQDFHLDGATAAPRSLSAAIKSLPVAVTIPQNWVIERRLELPIEAASHVDGIVASRLGALSPLPAADIVHGHEVVSADREARRISVVVAIVPRARVAPLLRTLAGATPRSIELLAPVAGSRAVRIRPGGTSVGGRNRGAKLLLSLLVFGSCVTAIGALAARPILGSSFDAQRAAIEARSDVARRVVAEATAPPVSATRPEQVALDLKRDAITAVGALEDLAQAMPLNAYATEIAFVDGLMRITGRTSDLPAVITALESSGRFAESRMVGASLRESDGRMSEFTLETRPLLRTGGEVR